jgi:hemerythrin-like domain-containing protein
MPVMVMLREHGEVWHLMDQLDELLAASEPDAQVINATSQQLLQGLAQHNAKEEPTIYPQTATDLSEEEAEILADFIAAGVTPQGWICEAAR